MMGNSLTSVKEIPHKTAIQERTKPEDNDEILTWSYVGEDGKMVATRLMKPDKPLQLYRIKYKNDKLTCGSIIGQTMYCHCSFDKRYDGELSFSRGDKLKIIAEWDEGFARAERVESPKETGLVPKMSICPSWYFGNMRRRDAIIQLLNSKNNIGAFLIRDCVDNHSTSNHISSLSMKVGMTGSSATRHFRIFEKCKENKVFIESKMLFDNIAILVKYYSEKALYKNQLLVRPCFRIKERYNLSPETKDHWEISHEEITVVKLIGSGKFGDVYFGYWKNTTEVAIKRVKHDRMPDKSFMEEAKIMKTLQCKNILPLFAVCTSRNPIYIITEFMDKGSLLDILREKDPLVSTFLNYIDVITQISYGMAYLEEKKLVHRDLAARNILMNKYREAKIADFGLAREIDHFEDKDISHPTILVEKFPVQWTAPEAMEHKEYHLFGHVTKSVTSKSDVWSFGIVLVEIFIGGRIPYNDWSNLEVFRNVADGYRMPRPANCPQNIYEDIILKCWNDIPEDRLTFAYVLDYFSSYDIKNNKEYLEIDVVN